MGGGLDHDLVFLGEHETVYRMSVNRSLNHQIGRIGGG
jgi:hypothetical protein